MKIKQLKSRRTLIRMLKDLKFKVGVEVGVRTGTFSKYMLEHTDMKVYSIDPYDFNAEQADPVYSYKMSRELLDPFGDRSVIIKGSSPGACSDFADYAVDFVYLDGLHTYEAVLADLNGWFNKVRPGGIIAGHDYSSTWPGVVSAVNEFTRKNNIQIMVTGKDDTSVPESDTFDEYQPSWWFYKR